LSCNQPLPAADGRTYLGIDFSAKSADKSDNTKVFAAIPRKSVFNFERCYLLQVSKTTERASLNSAATHFINGRGGDSVGTFYIKAKIKRGLSSEKNKKFF
jgi:hypothetical protein